MSCALKRDDIDMNFLSLLSNLEASGISVWARESEWAFFLFLIIHSLALAIVVGTHIAFNLRVLGVAKLIPLSLMKQFMAVMWPGVVAAILSGSVLLLAYPAKALTNPVFYVKLFCIFFALTIYQKIFLVYLTASENTDRESSSADVNGLAQTGSVDQVALQESRLKLYAITSLLLWLSSIFAGRFLAYTHSVLLASDYF